MLYYNCVSVTVFLLIPDSILTEIDCRILPCPTETWTFPMMSVTQNQSRRWSHHSASSGESLPVFPSCHSLVWILHLFIIVQCYLKLDIQHSTFNFTHMHTVYSRTAKYTAAQLFILSLPSITSAGLFSFAWQDYCMTTPYIF